MDYSGLINVNPEGIMNREKKCKGNFEDDFQVI